MFISGINCALWCMCILVYNNYYECDYNIYMYYQSVFRCQDYINIKAGSQKEICGNIDSLPRSDRTKYLTENLTVYFRTSEEVVNSGFMMAVLCLDQADIDGMYYMFV